MSSMTPTLCQAKRRVCLKIFLSILAIAAALAVPAIGAAWLHSREDIQQTGQIEVNTRDIGEVKADVEDISVRIETNQKAIIEAISALKEP